LRRSFGASDSAGLSPRAGERALPRSMKAPCRTSRRSWSTTPHEDGYLQLELRRYIRRDGSARERGPYWYFQFHEGGKRKKLYLGKTSDPEGTFATKRAKPSGE
jgi:hypothetical protein